MLEIKKILSFLSALIIALLAALLVPVISIFFFPIGFPIPGEIIGIIIISIILFTYFAFFSPNPWFRKLKDVGICRIISPEERGPPFRDPIFLSNAHNHIGILATSLNTFWMPGNHFVDYLQKAGQKNVGIEIMLLDPDSKHLVRKAIDEGLSLVDYKAKINNSISKFKNMKSNNEIQNIKVFLYDEYPIWHMIIIDRTFAKISYYPRGEDSNKCPYYVFKRSMGKYNFLEPFVVHFDELKMRSKQVI